MYFEISMVQALALHNIPHCGIFKSKKGPGKIQLTEMRHPQSIPGAISDLTLRFNL
jgi:hypothetical protein